MTQMRACLLANRIETKGLARSSSGAVDPAIVRLGEAGQAFVFRDGAAAFIGLTPEEERAFIEELRPRLREPFDAFEMEDAQILVRADGEEGVTPEGIALRGLEPERLIVVADVLAKAAALNHYEPLVQGVLERIEPLARELAREGRTSADLNLLSQRMGETIFVEIRLVARSAVAEKPEVLWDHPEHERLYARLEAEYELRDRALILERKLDTLRTTSTFITELIQNKRAHLLEWAIIWLIVFEIFLTLYTMFSGGTH